MSIFQVDVQKHFGGEFWTNVYFLEANDINTAHDAAVNVLVPVEQAVHTEGIVIDKVRTSTTTPNDRVFINSPRNDACTIALAGNRLPLFNIVRADLTVGTGDPSRKYYRSGMGSLSMGGPFEWDVTRTSAIHTALNSLMIDFATNGVVWVDESGNVITDTIVPVTIGMRQLRRGSKRRTQPVI